MKNNSHSTLKTVLEFLVLFAVIFFASQLLMRYVLSKDVVQGTSMQPTLENGDRLYSIRVKKPKRNDIVVINALIGLVLSILNVSLACQVTPLVQKIINCQ